ncbi:MAG TPA: coproporphyrinogen III oxidase family protein, partial [Candidatus Angelobacter sp.]|nr:coproporphyrinogen III oxidase family protein [Candidatus Angelobacter sp.]
HSMLPADAKLQAQQYESVRLATTDDYDGFFATPGWRADTISPEQALEESFFLGLRLNCGVDLDSLREEFGEQVQQYAMIITGLVKESLLQKSGENVRLTPRGRLLSNDVFERFIAEREPVR